MMIEDHIYYLFDPRNHDIKYVGETSDIQRRFKGHLVDRSNKDKFQWVYELSLEGLKPGIEIIETCLTSVQGKPEAREREFLWMLYFTQEGYDLLNYEVSQPQIKAFLRSLKQNIFEIHKGYSTWVGLSLSYRSTPYARMPALDHFGIVDTITNHTEQIPLTSQEQAKIERIRAQNRARKKRQRSKLKNEGTSMPVAIETSLYSISAIEHNRKLARERQRRHREKMKLSRMLGLQTK